MIPRLSDGGLLNNATIRNLIDQGQAGELAATYQINGLTGFFGSFFLNPFALGTNLASNFSHSTYALQVDVRTRMHRSIEFQANYVYSKTLTSATAGNVTSSLMDNKNPALERGRATFDVTHAIKGNFVYRLPAGNGHWFNPPGLHWLVGGWSASGIVTTQFGHAVLDILTSWYGESHVRRAVR